MPGIRPLSPELEAIARKELNEVPERRDEDIAHIKEWLERQPHLNARTDDQFLLMFLRGCKFSLERTKEKIDAYYTYRTALPELFTRRDPMLPELQEILNVEMMICLGMETGHGPLFLSRAARPDPYKSKMEDIMKLAFMMEEVILLENDAAIICGQNALIDLKGITLRHLAQLTPALVKKTLTCWQQGYPVRVSSVNYLHTPPIFEATLNFGRSLLQDKLKKRLFLYPNLEWINTSGLRPDLPKEYGGEAGSTSVLAAAWKAKLESYRDYFLEDEQYCADESRRPGKPKTQEDLFGMTGSFRKLIVD